MSGHQTTKPWDLSRVFWHNILRGYVSRMTVHWLRSLWYSRCEPTVSMDHHHQFMGHDANMLLEFSQIFIWKQRVVAIPVSSPMTMKLNVATTAQSAEGVWTTTLKLLQRNIPKYLWLYMVNRTSYVAINSTIQLKSFYFSVIILFNFILPFASTGIYSLCIYNIEEGEK